MTYTKPAHDEWSVTATSEHIGGCGDMESTNAETEQGKLQITYNNKNKLTAIIIIDGAPKVILLQVVGALNTDLTNVTASDLMLYVLANLWNEGQEDGFTIRHRGQWVRDFGGPMRRETQPYNPNATNFFKKAFPVLFLYRCEGIKGDHQPLSFSDHIKWTLQYHNK